MGFFRRDDPSPTTEATDEHALARYRYLLRTAPPDEIERAHEEAFARLTPEQRRQALHALAEHVPQAEIRGDDPASLARTATRAEMRAPGTIERAWGGGGAGFGLGTFFLSTLAASFIGTAVAQQLFADDGGAGAADAAGDPGADTSAADADLADTGEFGGGDVGGGDFGGGDFGGF